MTAVFQSPIFQDETLAREALEAVYDPAAWTQADAERFWSIAGPVGTRMPATSAIRGPHSELLDAGTRLTPDRSAV